MAADRPAPPADPDYPFRTEVRVRLRPIRDFDNVVVCGHLDFRAPARLHDVLTIDVRVGEIRHSSFRFDFRIRNKETGQLVAEGYTTHCAIDAEYQPIRVPDEFRRRTGAG
jgi:acyl-CoA thioesterase FadM